MWPYIIRVTIIQQRIYTIGTMIVRSTGCINAKIIRSFTLWSVAAAKSLQSYPTLCDPIDGSPPGSPVPGILKARTLEWVAISFSNAWKWKVKVKSFSHVWPSVTQWTAAFQALPSMGFSRQEYWSGVPLPSPRGVLGCLNNGATEIPVQKQYWARKRKPSPRMQFTFTIKALYLCWVPSKKTTIVWESSSRIKSIFANLHSQTPTQGFLCLISHFWMFEDPGSQRVIFH